MDPKTKNIIIKIATEEDLKYSLQIITEMEESAKVRGTGIAKRSVEYINKKMMEHKAIIALVEEDETWVGFSYIEAWEDKKFVANSGLIVSPPFRKYGVAKAIKQEIFRLSRKLFPDSKIFGLTTGASVMKINASIGYMPTTYVELTRDEAFWEGCRSCINYPILQSKERKNCLCTAMIYVPPQLQKDNNTLEKSALHYKIVIQE